MSTSGSWLVCMGADAQSAQALRKAVVEIRRDVRRCLCSPLDDDLLESTKKDA